MDAKEKTTKETNEKFQRVYQKCELLKKYFDLIDKRLMRNSVEKEILLHLWTWKILLKMK